MKLKQEPVSFNRLRPICTGSATLTLSRIFQTSCFHRQFLCPGEYDTPEAIWCGEMRTLMIQKLAYHLADFTPRLQSNNRAIYQYCPIPLVTYPLLEAELFCDIYYLRNLCNGTKFPAWPIAHPVRLLKEVLAAWRTEVDKKPATMSVDDAYKVINRLHGKLHCTTIWCRHAEAMVSFRRAVLLLSFPLV